MGWVNSFHDDVIKWKHLPRYWPFVRGIHRSPVNSSHKGQWRVAFENTIFHCDTGIFRSVGVNMLRPEHNGRHCEDDTFKCIFLYESRFNLIQKYRSKFHWNVLKRAQVTIQQHWFRLWHWTKQAPNNWANDNQSNDALHITMQASMCQMTWEHALTWFLLYVSIN